jgi:uncharacterized protein (TIGR03435 family)
MVMSSTASSIGSDRMSASSPAAVRSSDRNGSLLLPDAVSRQLGLKLDLERRPALVLVIDHGLGNV